MAAVYLEDEFIYMAQFRTMTTDLPWDDPCRVLRAIAAAGTQSTIALTVADSFSLFSIAQLDFFRSREAQAFQNAMASIDSITLQFGHVEDLGLSGPDHPFSLPWITLLEASSIRRLQCVVSPKPNAISSPA